MQLFPNIYVVLVGKAGVGKGIVINPATELLRFHKKKDFSNSASATNDNEKLLIEKIEQANQEDADAAMIKLKRGGEKVDATLFPYAPDATTYEALVESMSKSGRRINYTYINGEQEPKLGIYFHCSMYFSLPELASLMRKRTDDVVNYLLGLYDCPLDYEYKTKTKGEDRVRRGCLNLLAGTTPEFMETIFSQQLIDQGFSSRVFFIYANKNRKNVFSPEPLTEEQKSYRLDLLSHVKKLAGLYGEVRVSQETKAWLKNWWNEHETNRSSRSNISPKLDPYYGRKNIHVIKLAMIEHFSESTEMSIPLECFQRAIEFVEKEEKNMHLALTFESDNPLAKLTDKVKQYISSKGSATIVDLMLEFWKQCPQGKQSMEQVLQHLIGQGEVKEDSTVDELNKVRIVYKTIKE